MNRIEVIADRLRNTTRQLQSIDEGLTKEPENFALELAAYSLRNVEADLRVELHSSADAHGVQLCDYRLRSQGVKEPDLIGFVAALGEFQKLFALVYESIAFGVKKQRQFISPEAQRHCSFGISYVYSGSLGVMLSLPTEDSLFQSDNLNAAMDKTLQMAKCTSSDQVKFYAEAYGPAIIRSLYKWADAHLKNGLDPCIRWRDEDQLTYDGDTNMLVELQQAIQETSDVNTESVVVVGSLVAASLRTRRFILELDENKLIVGGMSKSITEHQTLELPKLYTAKLTAERSVNYATEQENVTYTLESLEAHS